MSQLMTLWYLSHRWPAKAQASLRIRAVSPEPSLFAHMKYGCRWRVQTKNQTFSPTGWLRMRVWRMSLRRMKSTIISWHSSFAVYTQNTCILSYRKLQTKSHSSGLIQWLCTWDHTKPNGPSHKIMALFFLHKLILQSRMHSGARCLIFGQILHLLPYFMCANSKGSGETVRMRRLAWAVAGHLCDKYHNLMSWIKCPFVTARI